MTSHERIEAALNHREPDRTPMYEYVLLPPIAEDLLKHSFVDYVGDVESWLSLARDNGFEYTVRRYAINRIDLACLLGHDMLYISPNPVLDESYFYNPLLEASPFASTKNLSEDPVKQLMQRIEKTKESKMNQPKDSFLVFEYLKEEMINRGIDLPIAVPAIFHGIWTDSDLMQTMILEPEIAHQWFSLATRRAINMIKEYQNLNMGIDQFFIGGDFAGIKLMISPDAYRRFILPEIRDLSRYIHSIGCWAMNGTDGNLWPVIDDFLYGCEVDGYFEVDMFAGMDLRRLKEEYGKKITFYGNMDCGNILSFKTTDEVKRYTIETIEAGLGNGGHIFSANNAITSSVPLKNYISMVNAYRDFFGLKKLDL